MWHQSDLQNSRGGAINHIGSGINHCVEDIFCHRCPLTITLCKTLTPPPPPHPIHPPFPPSLHQPPKRPPIGLERKKEERDVLSTTHLKCRLKFIESPACQPSEMLFSRENWRQWRHCFWRLTSRPLSFYFTAFAPQRHHYDHCQFYFRTATIGTGMRARKGEEEENGVPDLLDDRHSGDPINITSDANTKSAWGTSLQGQLPSVQRQAGTVAVVFTVGLNLPLSDSSTTLQPSTGKLQSSR